MCIILYYVKVSRKSSSCICIHAFTSGIIVLYVQCLQGFRFYILRLGVIPLPYGAIFACETAEWRPNMRRSHSKMSLFWAHDMAKHHHLGSSGIGKDHVVIRFLSTWQGYSSVPLPFQKSPSVTLQYRTAAAKKLLWPCDNAFSE
jgi:hypothetical protein